MHSLPRGLQRSNHGEQPRRRPRPTNRSVPSWTLPGPGRQHGNSIRCSLRFRPTRVEMGGSPLNRAFVIALALVTASTACSGESSTAGGTDIPTATSPGITNPMTACIRLFTTRLLFKMARWRSLETHDPTSTASDSSVLFLCTFEQALDQSLCAPAPALTPAPRETYTANEARASLAFAFLCFEAREGYPPLTFRTVPSR